MTRFVFSLVLAALSASAAVPSSSEGWYEPAGGKFKTQTALGSIGYLDYDGDMRYADIEVDANGDIVDADGVFNEYGIDGAMLDVLTEALKAQIASARNLERIDNMATNLDELFGMGGFEITNPDTGDRYRISIKGGTIAAAVKQKLSTDNYILASTDQHGDGVGCDNRSIATNSTGKLVLKNFPDVAIDCGKIPWFQINGLQWFCLGDLFDGKSVAATAVNGCENQVANGGISLAGWGSPKSGTHECSPTLASMLQADWHGEGENDKDSHYVLTRYGNASSTNAVLHYTKIGDLYAGNAIKFVGTDDSEATIGTSSTTNIVTFASASNSNVRVSVSPAYGGNVKITFGVYYK